MSSTSNCEVKSTNDGPEDILDESLSLNFNIIEESTYPADDEVLPAVLNLAELPDDDSSLDGSLDSNINELLMSYVPSEESKISAKDKDQGTETAPCKLITENRNPDKGKTLVLNSPKSQKNNKGSQPLKKVNGARETNKTKFSVNGAGNAQQRSRSTRFSNPKDTAKRGGRSKITRKAEGHSRPYLSGKEKRETMAEAFARKNKSSNLGTDNRKPATMAEAFARKNYSNSAVDNRKPETMAESFSRKHSSSNSAIDNRKPETMAEAYARKFNLSNPETDSRKPSARGRDIDRGERESSIPRRRSPYELDRTSKSSREHISRDRNTFVSERRPLTRERDEISRATRGRSPFARERRPLTSERDEINRATRGRSPFARERRPLTSERDEINRATRGRSPFARERSPVHREIRERSPFRSQRYEIDSNTRGRSPFSNERSQIQEQSRRRSPLLSERYELHRGTFGNEMSQFHQENRERNPFASERSLLHRETGRGNSSTSERTQLHSETIGIDPFTSERNAFTNQGSQLYPGTFGQNSFASVNPFTNEGNQLRYGNQAMNPFTSLIMHGVTQGRNPFTSGIIHGGNQGRNPFINERNQLHSNINEVSPFSSDKNQLHREPSSFNNDRDCEEESESSQDLDDPYERQMSDFKKLYENTERTSLIVPKAYPKQRFSKFEITILKAMILTHMSSMNVKSNSRLALESTMSHKGACLVTCKDQYTKAWLDNLVPQLKRKNGDGMRVGVLKELLWPGIRATMFLPGRFRKTPHTYLKQLARENPDIVTRHWAIRGRNKKLNTILLKINEADVVCLKKFNMQPKISGQPIRFELATSKKKIY
ncbi:uncharacterized protein [Diabrotica undecimpunctata]|uniref:uncharacterized protein n=1 Tax=Diabrotica undecimpunctata TaxID=50387 RepID=UPI003B6362F1